MNPPSKCIFCATDFSANAKEAELVATVFATRVKAKLVIGHAAEASTGIQFLGSATARLEDEAESLRRSGIVAQPALNCEPRTADALLTLIRAQSPQLVVISANQKTQLDTWSFASISEEVAQRADTPTLVVQKASAFASWHSDGTPLTVVVAVDLTTNSAVVLRWFKELEKFGPCKLIVCHANRRTDYPSTIDLEESGTKLVNPPSLQARLERDVRKMVSDALGNEEAEIFVGPTWTSPDSLILDAIQRFNADLAIVGTHQRQGINRLFHTSVSRALLHHAETNVVCVPLTIELDPRSAHIPQFKRILVATDLSPCGNAAIPFAYAACSVGGLVKLIHVVPYPVKHGDNHSITDLDQKLRGLEPEEAHARLTRSEFEVIGHRNPSSAICDEADRFGADLVCMASHEGGISDAVPSSVAADTLKKIRRPLFFIRPPGF